MPFFVLIYLRRRHGRIGEAVNTPDCGSGMQGFDPLILPQFEENPYKYKGFYFAKDSLKK